MPQITGIRRRVRKARQLLVLGEPPKRLRCPVRETRAMMRNLTALVVKVHGRTSIHHLQLIAEWAEAEVSRRALWMELRMKYPDNLTTEQLCMVRKDTQRYAAEKSRCIKELKLDTGVPDAYDKALSDDDDAELIQAQKEGFGVDDEKPVGYENVHEAFVSTLEEMDIDVNTDPETR